jgi:hypothetical protein
LSQQGSTEKAPEDVPVHNATSTPGVQSEPTYSGTSPTRSSRLCTGTSSGAFTVEPCCDNK